MKPVIWARWAAAAALVMAALCPPQALAQVPPRFYWKSLSGGNGVPGGATGGTGGTANAGAGTGGVGATAGDGGPATSAQVAGPRAIRYDAAGNLLLPLPQRVRVIAPDGVIHTIAGVVTTQGEDETLAVGSPVANAYAVAPAPDGSIYVVEFSGRRLRKLTPEQ